MFQRNHAQRKIYPKCTISQLPAQLMLEIFYRLPHYSILTAAQVCRRWNTLIGASARLMDSFTLRINPGTGPQEESYLAYECHLGRTERQYRRASITIRDQQSFLVAVLALRRLGQHLVELKLLLDQCSYHPSYFQMHFERMKEIRVGLDEFGQTLWHQEVDSYDRCLRPIAEPKKPDEAEKLAGFEEEEEEAAADFRRIEEVFLAFVYRYCFRLQKLQVKHVKNYWDTRTKIVYYEGTEMSDLQELEIYGTGFIVLVDSPNLRKLTIHGTTTGLPFYMGFRHAFPLLTHLEVIEDFLFDDVCLWAVSKRCSNLEELTLISSDNISQRAFCHINRLERLKKLSVSLQGNASEFTFVGWQPLFIEKLFISTNVLRVDTIREILMKNCNLMELVVCTRERIEYSMLSRLQQTRPSCQLIYRTLAIPIR